MNSCPLTTEDAPMVHRVPDVVRLADARDAAQMGAYAEASFDGALATASRQAMCAFAGIHGREWERLCLQRMAEEIGR